MSWWTAAVCGNGVIEKAKGEACEGANLMNATCASLGMGMGMLKCSPTTCQYDTSLCMKGPTGMGGHGGGQGGNGM